MVHSKAVSHPLPATIHADLETTTNKKLSGPLTTAIRTESYIFQQNRFNNYFSYVQNSPVPFHIRDTSRVLTCRGEYSRKTGIAILLPHHP